ncbi:MAG TPA: hypothetical protein VNI61_07920 [Gemmatimonadales bacterium]|nr:hypothetical protein [Gemmatimonadales bacterium]
MRALLSAALPLVLSGSRASPHPVPDLSRLPAARVVAHPERSEILIDLAPVDLPAGLAHEGGHAHGAQPPVALAVLPVGGALYGFRAEAIDSLGRPLPAALIHHVNVIDPENRELFLPISRRLLAAGRETGSLALPWLFFGVPLERGQRLVVSAVLHNPLGADFYGVRVRVVLRYTPEGRPWPVFRGAPFQLDVAFPVGDKSFDLPPGRTVRTYEASPAVPGTIVAIGGHLHDYGVSIEFRNATTGEVVWRAEPVRDSAGRLASIPVGRLYGLTRLGVRVLPSERYRVTVVYDNPTGRTLPAGGMGVVGGLFVPDDGVSWPRVDRADSLYWRDLAHYTRGLVAPQLTAVAHAH